MRGCPAIVVILFTTHAMAGGPFQHTVWDQALLDKIYATALAEDSSGVKGENDRVMGSGLAVLLGAFGAHRLYLGTTPTVAVFYGLTFGGFGVLALIDLGHLLFTKDLQPFRDNGRVFMWGERGKGATPP